MDKAQWSPINSEPTSAGQSLTARKPHPGLTRLPINFSNGTPVKMKKQYAEPSKHIIERPPVVISPTRIGDLATPEAKSHSTKPRDFVMASISTTNETGSSTPYTTISPDEHPSERLVEGKRHEVRPNDRNVTSGPSSRAGTQTPKISQQIGVPTITKRTQPQKPDSPQTIKKLYQGFDMTPPENDLVISERQFNTFKTSEPRQGSVKRTPGPSDVPANFTKDSPKEHLAEPHKNNTEAVQDRQPIEIGDQSSSSSDGDVAQLPTAAGRKAEEMNEEAVSPLMDEPDRSPTTAGLPDDHPIEWLAEARGIYQGVLPPFVTKQKVGVRRTVELPLLEGQRYAQKVEVVYRSWDFLHTFASIDVDGKRFIVKVFRGGATPYRPWLGPQTGFSETALAFSKQVPRGPKSWVATPGKKVPLPKGWALKEDDEKDDDYSPANRRKSAPVRRRPRLNYDLDEEEEEFDEGPYQEDSYQIAEQSHSERLSIEGDHPAHDLTGDQPMGSNTFTTQPPSKLINAVKKSLRLPKEQDVLPRPKQIKRRSIGGQGMTADSGGNKREKHKAVFSSDSEHSVPHKRAKATSLAVRQAIPSTLANPAKVSEASHYEPPTLDANTLSPYKQAHTTLRIVLVPYPQQSAKHRLRSCMTMATFFSTVVGVSGYKGDKDRIFGITATFDCKPDDDADKSMVIREEWQDSFDVFLETVDGAESWTEEGGKCGVAVSLLLTEG